MASTRPPNILWICTDQQRFDTIGAHGVEHVRTPTVDGLVADGTSFTHAYCQSPICTPSRASFLTGMYPSAVHVNGNGNECFPETAPPLVTHLLSEAGYDGGLVGKLHLASAYRRIEPRTADGYRFWRYSHAPRDDWPEGHDYADWVRAQGGDLKELTRSSEGVPAPMHQTTWCAAMAREFIADPARDAGQPWFLSVNIYDPHPPFNPPREYRERFDPAQMPGPVYRDGDLATQRWLEAAGVDFQSRAQSPEALDIRNPVVPASPMAGGGEEAAEAPADVTERRDAKTLQAAYFAMIELIDDNVKRMLDTLGETGQADDTVVIFTSDHGETLGDHGLIQKGCRFYEGLVRVPLIFRAPGVARQGAIDDSLVELTDLAPTLLELAGQPIPDAMQGRSLVSRLRGDAMGRHRDFVRCEYYDALDEPDGTLATMYRDDRYKLCVYHGKPVGELYDLERDPGEHVNLWDDPAHAERRIDLMKKSFDASVVAMDRGPRRIGPM